MLIRKRILPLLLALVLVVLMAAPAFAADSPAPVIFLSGFGTELYLNDGTPEEQGVLLGALTAENIFGALGAVVLGAFRDPLALLCSPNWAADLLSSFAVQLLGNLACDADGNSAYPVSNTSRTGRSGTYEGRPFYQFHYDWRLDPMETARSLNDFIQEVKEETGSAKVAVDAISFGGIVSSAYLEQFGTGDLESLFLCVSAHGGMTFVEDLIQGEFAVSGAGLAAFLGGIIPDDTGILAPTLGGLNTLGVFRLLERLLNAGLGSIEDRFYEQAVIPLLVQMPAVWAFVTDDAIFERSKSLLLSDTEKYAGLIAKINDYHYSVGNHANRILADAAQEIKLALVCGYDSAPVPLGGTFLYQSDFLIDTARESGGAVCAPYGKTLPAGYVQAKQDGHNHISADRVIDASTCVLPEQTWFVKGYQHQAESGGAGLYAWFLRYDGQPTVWSDAGHPQFM
ncbi:MAG: hypothetical protein LBS96_00640 [Oscillospiraceae bacterium]|jgi:hypothetical protein|nr:hypothetical protein [Oscillospiraceae bacterium]